MPIITFLASGLAKLFADKVIGFLALKILLVTLFTIIVPIILNNFLYDIIQIVMNYASAQTAGSGVSADSAMNFSGFAGYLVATFQFPQALSVMVSALMLRLCLSMIPFVRL